MTVRAATTGHRAVLPTVHLSKHKARSGSTPPIMYPLCCRDAEFEAATSTAAGRFDCRDVDFLHLHHGIERALGGGGVRIGDRLCQGDWGNLPGQAPFVLAPTAVALLAAVADDGVPVAIGFGLVGGGDLKRECEAVLDSGAAVEAEAGDAHHGKFDGQYVALLPGWVVSRGAVDGADGGIGKGFGVKPRRVLGVAIVPKANRVLCWLYHVTSPSR
jgi:hypothetical protein